MASIPGAERKIAAGVTGILLGALGVHKFVLGYTKEGLIMLGATLLTIGFAAPLVHLIGVIEGIVYLTKSDEDFVSVYVKGHRGWF
ncbi:MAG: TM2 domain-containing protein [Candidatus Eisenbacteria bacterium]